MTIPAGTYWFAQTCSKHTTIARGVKLSANVNGIFNRDSTRAGVAENGSRDGVLPETLGRITAQDFNMALAIFLP